MRLDRNETESFRFNNVRPTLVIRVLSGADYHHLSPRTQQVRSKYLCIWRMTAAERTHEYHCALIRSYYMRFGLDTGFVTFSGFRECPNSWGCWASMFHPTILCTLGVLWNSTSWWNATCRNYSHHQVTKYLVAPFTDYAASNCTTIL